MRLDKIELRGFKSIKSLNLELNALNILIGANGSGKSNFINLFRLLNQMIEKNFQLAVAKVGGAETLLFFGSKVTKEIYLKLTFGRNEYECIWEPTADDRLIFSSERAYFHGDYPKNYTGPYEEPLGKGQKETQLHEEADLRPGRVGSYVLESLQSWRLYHFHDTSESAPVKKGSDINDNAFLRSNASNLAAFLFLLKKNNRAHYQNVVDTVKLVTPFFRDFYLEPSALNPNQVVLAWQQAGSDEYLGAHSLSDGTLRFICIVTLLLQPRLPSTIVIDEPELGLHPYAINVLAGLLKSVSTRSQIIISTQSVTLVNQFGPEDIIVVDRENEESVFKRPNEQQIASWLDSYSLGELWEKNILGGRPT